MIPLKYKANYKYQVKNRAGMVFEMKFRPPIAIINRWYSFDARGSLFVAEGYAWNGASGPTFDTKAAVYASLPHDVIYQMMRRGELDIHYRKVADQEFRRMLVARGMSRFRATYWYYALRWAGRKAALPESIQPVLEA